MARLALYPHAPSVTINEMFDVLRPQINRPNNLLRLRTTRATDFRGRNGDLIFNYGRGNIPQEVIGNARIINNPNSVNNASNKVEAFRLFSEAGVPTVENTTDRSTASAWLAYNEVVYARTQTRGHSGEGIIVCHNNLSELGSVGGVQTSEEVVQAPLYTKGVTGARREFRLHVLNGQVVFSQQKRRVEGAEELEHYSNVVRNHHTGWIYAISNVSPNRAGINAAIAAVQALGLDYGAVDIITNQENAWVLEVNTAPGMTGTNLQNFCNNLLSIFTGVPVETPVQEAAEESESVEEAPEVVEEPTAEPTQLEVTEMPVSNTPRIGSRFRVTSYDNNPEGFVITGRHLGILHSHSVLTVDRVSPTGRVRASNIWFSPQWVEVIQENPRPFVVGDIAKITNFVRTGSMPAISATMRSNFESGISLTVVEISPSTGWLLMSDGFSYHKDWLVLNLPPLTVGDSVRVNNLNPMDHFSASVHDQREALRNNSVLTVSSCQVDTTGRMNYSLSDGYYYPREWLIKVIPEELALPVFNNGQRVIVSNFNTDSRNRGNVRYPNVNSIMESTQREGLVRTVIRTRPDGRVLLSDSYIYHPTWLTGAPSEPIVDEVSSGRFNVGDSVVVSNLNRNGVGSYPSIVTGMRRVHREGTVMTVTRVGQEHSNWYELNGNYWFHESWLSSVDRQPGSIAYVSNLTPVVDTYGATVSPGITRAMQSTMRNGTPLVVGGRSRDFVDSYLMEDGFHYHQSWLSTNPPASTAETVPPAPPQVAPAPVVEEPAATVPAPANNSVCRITSSGHTTVGLFVAARSAFDVVGFEVPISLRDVTLCEVIGTL